MRESAEALYNRHTDMLLARLDAAMFFESEPEKQGRTFNRIDGSDDKIENRPD